MDKRHVALALVLISALVGAWLFYINYDSGERPESPVNYSSIHIGEERDILVANEDDAHHTFHIEVVRLSTNTTDLTREPNRTVLTKSVELAPDNHTYIRNITNEVGFYNLNVTLENGRKDSLIWKVCRGLLSPRIEFDGTDLILFQGHLDPTSKYCRFNWFKYNPF